MQACSLKCCWRAPSPAPGGVRGVNRHARFAPQATFPAWRANGGMLPKFTVNYGKLRWFCCGARELVIAGPPRGQDSNTSGTALILLPLPERFRNWERDRLGRSGRRPAGQPHPSHHLVASSIRKGFRPEAENRERDAPAPRKQLNRSGPGRNIWRTVLALRTSVRQIQSCVFPPRGVKFSTLMQACAPLCTIKNAWPGVLPQAGRVGEH
jgi:hypothetical protein